MDWNRAAEEVVVAVPRDVCVCVLREMGGDDDDADVRRGR